MPSMTGRRRWRGGVRDGGFLKWKLRLRLGSDEREEEDEEEVTVKIVICRDGYDSTQRWVVDVP